jgi:hypothetical protein
MRTQLWVILLLGLARAAVADSTAFLRASLHGADANTYRVISIRGNVAQDVTASGFRVGVADGEEHFALCRPVMYEDVGPFVNYQVAAVVPQPHPVNASYFIPPFFWNASSTPQRLATMTSANPMPATTAYVTSVFTNLLQHNNNPSFSLGFLIRSTTDFRKVPITPDAPFLSIELFIGFVVRVRNFAPICPDVTFNLPTPPPQPITNFLMFWSTTRSGLTQIVVNNVPIFPQPIRVTGQNLIQTKIPSTVLIRGQNAVAISVQEDNTSVSQAPLTTTATLNIGDIICPFDPSLPPPRMQPPK